VAKEVN